MRPTRIRDKKLNNADIVAQLERMCGKVVTLKNGWSSFVYHHLKIVYIPDPKNDSVRMTIPHLTKIGDYKKDKLERIINETNREVKFVKLIFLNNGSVSMKYDYKIIGVETVAAIVKHMVETLYMASEYFMFKLQTL